MTLLDVEHLSKTFPVRRRGTLRAVDDVSFAIGTHETLSLVGESGCGKTTTARSILHLTAAPNSPPASNICYARLGWSRAMETVTRTNCPAASGSGSASPARSRWNLIC
jgi:ABC-type glutathione transport system ATPase component